ncbi:MAG: hypothetical protein R3B70_17430 [Polyangiaceae bacterium]
MPTPLNLDSMTSQQLCDLLDDQCHSKGFTLTDGAKLSLHENKPKEKSVLDGIKSKLDPYIDFGSGGLKLYQFEHRGTKGTFTVNPGFDKGGPNVTLQFNLRF